MRINSGTQYRQALNIAADYAENDGANVAAYMLRILSGDERTRNEEAAKVDDSEFSSMAAWRAVESCRVTSALFAIYDAHSARYSTEVNRRMVRRMNRIKSCERCGMAGLPLDGNGRCATCATFCSLCHWVAQAGERCAYHGKLVEPTPAP